MRVIDTSAPMAHPVRAGFGGAPRERPVGATGHLHLTFAGVLRGEWIKLLSLRSIRWSLGLVLLLNWAGAATIAWAVTAAETLAADSAPFVLVQTATLGTAFTVLIMGCSRCWR